MTSHPADEPSTAAITAWLLPAPLLLQAFFNLLHIPVHENWRIGGFMAVIALIQAFCLWRRVVAGVLVWLAVECAVLTWVNIFLMGVPPPEYSGESRLNEGWLWGMFALVGMIGGGVLALVIEPWYRLWQLTPRAAQQPGQAQEEKATEPAPDKERKEE